ncbi:MAG: hypothetical protein ABIP48_08390, partial [Planctomycetota bacterium]
LAGGLQEDSSLILGHSRDRVMRKKGKEGKREMDPSISCFPFSPFPFFPSHTWAAMLGKDNFFDILSVLRASVVRIVFLGKRWARTNGGLHAKWGD